MVGMRPAAPLTDLIQRARDGDADAFRAVFDTAYQDLRGLARMRLSRGGRGTLLDTTSLVHESYLRFVNSGSLRITDRDHFLRYASQVMRSVIVDIARAGKAERRGGDAAHVPLNTALGDGLTAGEEEIVRVHEALEELQSADPRMVQVVEMRYFCGLTEEEIGATLGVGIRTVRRDWEKAKLFLARALASP
jgi:RNA polymerase sigma factor (TIGR02999 family)